MRQAVARLALCGLVRTSLRYTSHRGYAVGTVLSGKGISVRGIDNAPLLVDDLFGKKKVALVGIPGAFTPVCTSKHLPEFVAKKDALLAAGFDEVVVLTVNDSFVVKAFAEHLKADGITFVADWDGALSEALGTKADLSAAGLGSRSTRFTAYLNDGKVVSENVEDSPGDYKVTDPATLISQLKDSLS
eukprot:TRINITY_DN6062_c0_g1_i1.p1 TRINITY_DN6062_c0_g1~~TRINITY_DN6062_c0_g1_i1.p1  ORF type:complete len:188 (-),score=38.09 TRINITY_DN6062_c0_g1_i1:56-619(-)